MPTQPPSRLVRPPCPRPRQRPRKARQPARLEVDVATADGMVFVNASLDLSLGGMCLEIGAPLAPGDRVMLHLRLPGPGSVVATEAVVRRARALADGIVVGGLSLPALPPRELHMLRTFLDAEAA